MKNKKTNDTKKEIRVRVGVSIRVSVRVQRIAK
jgi:hypothetical protein